jgi:ATP-dependent DNA helicase RecG
MQADKVKELIAGGETLTVEFKGIASGKLGSSVFETVAAFSNRYGGHILMGVDGQRSDVRGHIAFEVVSNVLSHQEFASSMPARVTIERDRLVAENWNRPLRPGPIDPDNFKPDPKNPLISAFFVNIAYADRLGSGVRNLYKYSRIYTGQDPQLVEGDVFTTIISLPGSVPSDGTDDGTEAAQKLLDSERAVLDALRAKGSLTIRTLVATTGLSERQVKRILVSLREYGLLRREGSDRAGRWVVL